MFATIRRIALAVAGAAALVAAGRARADHQLGYAYQPPAPGYQVEPYQPPATALTFSLVLPAPPAWLGLAPPPPPVYGAWTRVALERQYRWLDLARARFYRYGAGDPWRARQFEAWYQARHAALDRCWPDTAWAPAPRYGWRQGWRGAGWYGRGEGWERGRRGHERWERDD